MELFIGAFLILLLVFILGAALASFFNALIYRLEKEMPIKAMLSSPSHCEKCERELNALELFPIVGWLIGRGKCKKCGYKVPSVYPLTELLLGSSLVALYWSGAPLSMYLVVLMVAFLALYDLRYQGFPKAIVHILLEASALYYVWALVSGQVMLASSGIWVGIALALVILLLNRFKESFGLGDIFVFLLISMFISWELMIVLFWAASLVGAIVVTPLLLTGRLKRDSRVPFVPFIFIGLMLVLMYQDPILDFFDSVSGLWYFYSSII